MSQYKSTSENDTGAVEGSTDLGVTFKHSTTLGVPK